jgi:fatty acid desaturase
MAQRPPPEARHRLPRLRNGRDWQSLAYLAALPALAAWQWVHGFSAVLYALMLFLTLGVGVIHHNHVHLRMWRGRRMNRLTDSWITLLQGHPTFVFWPAHVGNHHRHRHGPKDLARTYRFGGDTNHLRGYLLHPFQAVWVLVPVFVAWLGRLRRHRRGAWRYCMAQYALWLGSWALLLALDWRRALLFVIVPQLHGLHWLLATNYLQHAHADGRKPSRKAQVEEAPGDTRGSQLNYARNFEGLVNPLLFNIGLHTAHHENPHAHWSELAHLHRTHYRARVDPVLNEGGLVAYMVRVFVLGPVWPRCRSRPLMPPDSPIR